MPCFWKYEDEENFIKILELMKDILVKKGIRILRKLSMKDERGATKEMYHELYLHHEELAKKFETKDKIRVTGFDKVNVDKWFEVIEKRAQELKKGEYQEAQKELVEMAAFFGGSNWYDTEEDSGIIMWLKIMKVAA